MSQPIDMVLFCPMCGVQHIDAPENPTPKGYEGWTNPPHKSHLCHECSCIWRPADVPTNGVASILTRGERDNFELVRTLLLNKLWQPIDTAPRDGTFILCAEAVSGYVHILQWSTAVGYWRSRVTDDNRGWTPVAWQSVPKYVHE